MDAKTALTIMRQTAASATLEDAAAFLAICQDRGLTPFLEVSPIIMDYQKRDGSHVHSMNVKEKFTVQERWAAQCGGYTVWKTEVRQDGGNLVASVGVLANSDYAAVGKMAAMGIPGFNFREELERFVVWETATVTARERERQAPNTKTWEQMAEKRAREAALRRRFGQEPSQSRQLYTNALSARTAADGAAALYGGRVVDALPAPVDYAPQYETGGEVVVTTSEPSPAPVVVQEEAPVAEDNNVFRAVRVVVKTTKNGGLVSFWYSDDGERASLFDTKKAPDFESLICSVGEYAVAADVEWLPDKTGQYKNVVAVTRAPQPLPAPPQAQAQPVRTGEHPHLRAVMREFPEIGEDILAAVLRGAAHTLSEIETVDYARAYSAAKRAGDTNPTYEAQAAVGGDMSIVVAQAWRTKSGAPVFSALTGAQLENIADDPKSSPLTKQAARLVLAANARAAQDNVPQP